MLPGLSPALLVVTQRGGIVFGPLLGALELLDGLATVETKFVGLFVLVETLCHRARVNPGRNALSHLHLLEFIFLCEQKLT